MGQLYNTVLSKHGYDPSQKSSYSGGTTYNTKTPFNASRGQNSSFVENTIRSIGNVGGQVIGGAFNAAKQSLWDEPGRLIQHVYKGGQNQFNIMKDQMGAVQQAQDWKRRQQQGQRISQQEIDAVRQRTQQNVQRGNANMWDTGSTFIVGTKNYREKYLPVALTAASIASLGATSPLSAGAKVAQTGTKLSLGQRAGNFGLRMGDDLFGFGKTFGKGLPMNVAGKIARNELLVKPTISDLSALPGQVGKGDYTGAAINAALLASGGLKNGPIGTARSLLTAGSSKIGQQFKSNAGVFDLIKIKGGDSIYGSLQKVAKTSPQKAQQIEGTLKVYQDYLINQWGDAKTASKAFSEYIGGKDLSKMSLTKLTKELDNFRNSDVAIRETAIKMAKKGLLTGPDGKKISVEQAKHVGAVRSPGGSFDELVGAVSTSSNKQQLQKSLQAFGQKNPDFIANEQNRRLLQGISESGSYGDEAAKLVKDRFRKTKQVFGDNKSLQAPGGFVGGMRSGVNFKNVDEVGDLQHGKDGILAGIGRKLDQMGISPSSSSEGKGRYISEKIRSSMDEALAEAKVNRGADEILSKLRTATENRKGVFDIRQLRSDEVAKFLKTDKAEAKKILGAYKKAIKGLSLEDRGLAGKITDLNLNYNPLAAPYSRVQNAAKYEMNPFFSLQERIETRIGTAALTGKTRMPGRDYTKQVDELEQAGFWENAGFGSEGADIGNVTNITSKLKEGQKKTLAAGIDQLANKQGKTITEFISDPKNADLMQDFKTVVQYPDRGFTSSNLSKLMNLVAFPTRYNVKIAQFAVKQLAKAPGLVQVQVIKGLGDYNEFMNSPEGIKFQSDNKELLGLVKYFTPMGNVQQVMDVLQGKAKRAADFGLIGGLPFGVITQALQGQGLIETDSPYVDPRTGEIYSEKVPESLKARAFQLMSDVIGTMYNYPGRMVGLPVSKKDANEMIPTTIMGKPGKGEYNTITRTDVSAEDQRRMDVLKAGGDNKMTPLTLPGRSNLTTLKAPGTLIAPPKAKAKKAKKSRPRPIPIQRLISR